MSSRYTAFLLSPETKQALIARFPPAYPQLKADHITYRYGGDDFEDLFHPEKIEITGIADDGNGIQALIVKVDGAHYKPDGRPYHLTWSLDSAQKAPDIYTEKGNYRPVHANDLVARILGGTPAPGDSFTPIDPPLEIKAVPAHIEKDNQGHTTRTLLPAPHNREKNNSAPPPPKNPSR